MSHKSIVKNLKKAEKTGVPVVLTPPPSNLGGMNFGGPSGQPTKITIFNERTGQQETVPVLNAQLLAKLREANLLIQRENETESTKYEEPMASDDSNDNSPSEPIIPSLQEQETNNIQHQSLLEEDPQIFEEVPHNHGGNFVPSSGLSTITEELLGSEYPHSNQCCATCRVTLALILNTVTEIKERASAGNNNSQVTLNSVRSDLLPKRAITKIKTFNLLEKNLTESKDCKAALINDLNKIGGKGPQKGISNVLEHLFSNEFAAKSSWTGLNGGVKLKDTVVAEVLTEYLVNKYQASHHETRDSIQDRIKNWFQRGSDRLKNQTKLKVKAKAKLAENLPKDNKQTEP